MGPSSDEEITSGMKQIERAIEQAVSEADDPASTVQPIKFTWGQHHAGSPPEAVPLQVDSVRGTFNAELSREQLEDSAEHVDRPEVLQLIRRAANWVLGRGDPR